MSWLNWLTPTVCERVFGTITALGTYVVMSINSPLATIPAGKMLLGGFSLTTGYAGSRFGYNFGVVIDYLVEKCGFADDTRRKRMEDNQSQIDFLAEMSCNFTFDVQNYTNNVSTISSSYASLRTSERRTDEFWHRMSINQMRHDTAMWKWRETHL